MKINRILTYAFWLLGTLLPVAVFYPGELADYAHFLWFAGAGIMLPGAFILSLWGLRGLALETALLLALTLGCIVVTVAYMALNASPHFDRFAPLYHSLIIVSGMGLMVRRQHVLPWLRQRAAWRLLLPVLLAAAAVNAVYFFGFFNNGRVHPEGLYLLGGVHDASSLSFVMELLRPAPHTNPLMHGAGMSVSHYMAYVIIAAGAKLTGLPALTVYLHYYLYWLLNALLFALFVFARKLANRHAALVFMVLCLFFHSNNAARLFIDQGVLNYIFTENTPLGVIFWNAFFTLLLLYESRRQRRLFGLLALVGLFMFTAKAYFFANMFLGICLYLLFRQRRVNRLALALGLGAGYLLLLKCGWGKILLSPVGADLKLFALDKFYHGALPAWWPKGNLYWWPLLCGLPLFLLGNFSFAALGAVPLLRELRGDAGNRITRVVLPLTVIGGIIAANTLTIAYLASIIEFYTPVYYVLLLAATIMTVRLYRRLPRGWRRHAWLLIVGFLCFGNGALTLNYVRKQLAPPAPGNIREVISRSDWRMLSCLAEQYPATHKVLQPRGLEITTRLPLMIPYMQLFNNFANKRVFLEDPRELWAFGIPPGDILRMVEMERAFYTRPLTDPVNLCLLADHGIDLVVVERALTLTAAEQQHYRVGYADGTWTVLEVAGDRAGD